MGKRKNTAFICNLFILGLFWFSAGCSFEGKPDEFIQESSICKFEFQPGGKVRIPDYQKFELKNGIVLYLMEDKRFPIVNFYAKLRVGTVYDPEDKLGLAEMTMELLRSGGTQNLSGDQIDEKLERVGAAITTDISHVFGQISGYSLKRNFPEVFEIFRQILQEPLFSQDKLDLVRIGKIAEIARRDDRVAAIADRELRKLVYGQKHPYSRIIEFDTIANIKRQDILDFYQKHIGPDGMVLAVWGDFDQQEMLNKIKDSLGTWPKKDLPDLPYFKVDADKTQSLDFFIRADLTQSQIAMGHLGLRRDHPDFPACLVLSRILGIGWNSRFMRHLRQEKALAYSLYASHVANFGYPGLFIARAQTKIKHTRKAIDLMKSEIKRIRRDKVKLQELDAAKESILNHSVFWFDAPDKIMERLVRYQYYGYPEDYLENLLESLKAVTVEDIMAAANKHIRPEQLSLFVVTTPDKAQELKAYQKE